MPRSSQYSRRAYTIKRAKIAALKNVPCRDCGVRYPPFVMHFDHRPGEKKLGDISRLYRIPWSVLLEEIAKCDVVCANCHATRTWWRHGAKPWWVEPKHPLLTRRRYRRFWEAVAAVAYLDAPDTWRRRFRRFWGQIVWVVQVRRNWRINANGQAELVDPAEIAWTQERPQRAVNQTIQSID
jgi:hypothetical protein